MPHHVLVRLPDGRDACADYRQPVVTVMRRILAACSAGQLGDNADYALVAEWLDYCPGQACLPSCTDGPDAPHPPADREPVTLPPYRRPEAAVHRGGPAVGPP
jgi:hypothetical protein